LDVARYEPVKLRSGDLRVGMFVCELDRPWAETPFPFQGFGIESDSDVEEVKRHCDYVYIDLGRTRMVRVKIDAVSPPMFAEGKPSSSLEEEVPGAEAAQEEASSLVNSFLEDIRLGQSIDLGLAQSTVSRCVASALRNPDALALMARMQDKNPHIASHAFSACVYSIILGRLQGFDAKRLEMLGLAGLLHDIGQIEIPDEILNKTGALGEEEFALVKRHTTFGRDILLSMPGIPRVVAEVAYGHHECPDGSGYPQGLKDAQIDLNCKIVAVVDKYEAITRNTAYRSAQTHLDAVHLLSLLADSGKIDKALCASFVSYMGFYPPGTIVELSSGEVAIVLKSNSAHRLRPLLLVVRDIEGNPLERIVDLAVAPVDSKGKGHKIKMVHLPGYRGIDLSKYQSALIHAYD
jgi:HD-GYP domain-containing protein (c-di-GMP phosphodiesterase class II)